MIRRACVAGIVLLAVAIAAGCGSSKSPETKSAEGKASSSPTATPTGTGQQSAGQQTVAQGAQQTAQGAQQAAQGLQQMAQGLQQMSKGAATPVDFEVLKTMLPDINGWTKSDVHGEVVSFGVSQSNAKAIYTKGESRIELSITDSALNQLLLAPLSMVMNAGFEEKSDDGYKKATTVGGYPGYEEWDKGPKHAEATALVANRFVVSAEAHGVDTPDVARKAVEAIDLKKLAGLK